ncbi:MAG TPA: hypothetical protein VGF34_18655 [Stellaceae bacterium]|jgi:NO-binding membrane sensor protein with MHYT domain
MSLVATSTALGICLSVLAVAIVLDRRPYRPGKFNYIPLMILCLAICLLLGRHLLTLML